MADEVWTQTDRPLSATRRRASLVDLIARLLDEDFEKRIEALDENTRFNDDLEMDSLDVLAMVAEVETRVAVEIDAREIAELATVGQVVDLLIEAERRVAGAETPMT